MIPAMYLELALAAAAGAAAGAVYFHLLRRTADAIAVRAGAGRVLALAAARLALAAGVLGGLAALGALPLLLGFAGFLAARQIVLLRARRAAANP